MTRQKRTARTRAMQRRRKFTRRIERATGRVFANFEEACKAFTSAIVEGVMPVFAGVIEGLQAFASEWQKFVDSLTPEERGVLMLMLDEDEDDVIFRLTGNDEDGWCLDDGTDEDSLLRVWDTAEDAMAELPGDWWQEDGCWFATEIQDDRGGMHLRSARSSA